MGIHDGHRERLHEQFNANGLDSFTDIQALELLLFFSIPRCDTNPIAHRLLDKFGSLSAVLDAERTELCTVEGIGPKSADLIQLVPQIMRKYEIDRVNNIKKLASSFDAGKFIVSRFKNYTSERFLAIAVDGKRNVISDEWLAEGSSAEVAVQYRDIIAFALKTRAVELILAHNHPSGPVYPSNEDLFFTRECISALELIQVPLCDHFIVSNNDFFSFADHGMISK